MKKNKLIFFLFLVMYFIPIKSFALGIFCPTGTYGSPENIEHGSRVSGKDCVECGSVPQGCPCAPSCASTPITYTCICDEGYTSYPGNSTTTPCTCIKECEAGYYKDGDNCSLCPSNSTSDKGATSISDCYCKKNYYGSNGICKSCPENGLTKSTKTTSINGCYIPSNTVLNDQYGTYTYDADCFYSN